MSEGTDLSPVFANLFGPKGALYLSVMVLVTGVLEVFLLKYLLPRLNKMMDWTENMKVSNDLTVMVRQLQPTPEGLPLEVYSFADDTDWVKYEGIQSDIFDHLLAVLPDFGLRVFQNPTGRDLKRLQGRQREANPGNGFPE